MPFSLLPARPPSITIAAIPGQYGFGNNYTCAANLTNGAYNGGTCTPINLYDPQTFYRRRTDHDKQLRLPVPVGELHQDQVQVRKPSTSASMDRCLRCQGGDVKAAVGDEHRSDYINDLPGELRANNELADYGAAGNTKGSDTVNEVSASSSCRSSRTGRASSCSN